MIPRKQPRQTTCLGEMKTSILPEMNGKPALRRKRPTLIVNLFWYGMDRSRKKLLSYTSLEHYLALRAISSRGGSFYAVYSYKYSLMHYISVWYCVVYGCLIVLFIVLSVLSFCVKYFILFWVIYASLGEVYFACTYRGIRNYI